jgi:hypothetical protein
MKTVAVLIAGIFLSCASALPAQVGPPEAGQSAMYFQQPLPPPEPGASGPNVFFHTQKLGDERMSTGYFAIAEPGKPVSGAPYSGTSTTETTQVLADGNRIMNKTGATLARDSQGRTRREETMSTIGPLATKGPKLVFINDPVAKMSYVLDLNMQTAQVIKLPDGPATIAFAAPGASATGTARAGTPHMTTMTAEKRVIVSGSNPGVEQRIWVDSTGDPSQMKTEQLGTQVIEGVSAEGVRTTRTIPAGQIGNERPLEITSEVWTSPELQMVILSKRNDPRFGETVYKLTDIKRAEPDPTLFQVPANFSIKNLGN